MSHAVSVNSHQPPRELAPESDLPVLLAPLLGRDQETVTLRQFLHRPDVRYLSSLALSYHRHSSRRNPIDRHTESGRRHPSAAVM